MEGIIAAALVCGFVLYMWHQAKPYVERILPDPKVVKKESDKQVQGTIPSQLWMMAMGESEEWARESRLKDMYQMYRDSGNDWDRVAHLVSLEGGRDTQE